MQGELKAKWVEALRSGKYQQCRGGLHDGTGFCCLGVIADLVRGEDRWVPNTGPASKEKFRLEQKHPRNVAASDFYTPIEELIGRGRNEFVTMNDDQGRTFTEIADYIEANIPSE